MYIINDIWLYIKTFLFHNIKTQGKHLKNNPNIENYNKSIKIFNTIIEESSNPRIILYPSRNNFRIVRFIYEINFKQIKQLIIIYQKYKEQHPKYLDLRRDYLYNIRKLN